MVDPPFVLMGIAIKYWCDAFESFEDSGVCDGEKMVFGFKFTGFGPLATTSVTTVAPGNSRASTHTHKAVQLQASAVGVFHRIGLVPNASKETVT